MHNESYLRIRNQLNFKKILAPNLAVLAADAFLFFLGLHLLQSGNWAAYLVAQSLFVLVFFHAFGIFHEAVHGTIAESRRVNTILGTVCGAFCFLPFESWKTAHLQHHRWSGNVDKDPVMRLVKTFDPNNERQMLFYNISWRSWLPIMAVLQHLVFWSNAFLQLKDKSLGGKLKARIFLSTIIPPAIYLTAHAVWPALFNLTNFLPAIVVYLSLTEVINFPHHLGRERLEEGHALPKDQYRFTRSCYYPSWLATGGLLNFNFHIEHHLYPTLPWYQLDKARPLVKEALGGAYVESHHNEWIIENRGKDIRHVVLPPEERLPEYERAS